MSVLFFLLVTPVGVLFKLSGKNLLLLKKPDSKTYWQTRSDDEFRQDFMKDQF